MLKIVSKLKHWWKYSSPIDKFNTALNIIEAAGIVYCAGKIEKKIDHAFDHMDIRLILAEKEKPEDPDGFEGFDINTSGPERHGGLELEEKEAE